SQWGYGAETDRTFAEFARIAANGGTVSPGMAAVMLAPNAPVPPDVRNDCDFSGKSWAVKYLEMMVLMKGRGVTPSTDINGLVMPPAPRYGLYACRRREGAEAEVPNHLDDWPRDFQQGGACDTNSLGAWNPVCWSTRMLDGQMQEGSGVVYDDYGSRPQAT